MIVNLVLFVVNATLSTVLLLLAGYFYWRYMFAKDAGVSYFARDHLLNKASMCLGLLAIAGAVQFSCCLIVGAGLVQLALAVWLLVFDKPPFYKPIPAVSFYC